MSAHASASRRRLARGALTLGLALVAAACPDASERAADQDAATRGDDGVTTSEPSDGRVTDGEARVVPLEQARCARAPVDLYGQLAWVDGDGVWLADRGGAAPPRLVDALADGETAAAPVVLARAAAAPSLWVAVHDPRGCELRAYDGRGARVGAVRVDGDQCFAPAVARSIVAWPIASDADEGGGRVVWIHAGTRLVLAETALGGRPVGAPAVLGPEAASGGGSHWIVGTTDGLVAFDDDYGGLRLDGPTPDPTTLTPPTIVGRFAETAGTPTAVAALDDRVVLALRAPGDADAFGARVRVVAIDTRESGAGYAQDAGLIDLPAPMRTPPLVVAPPEGGCPSVAGGGSHWLCRGAATLVAGGDGWVAGFDLSDGERVFSDDVALDWTGLAVGDGGWIAGGGSHWQPQPDGATADGWSLVALDPDRPGSAVELAGGADAACVPSPLWGSDGLLATPVVTAMTDATLVRVPSGAPALGAGLADGWSRPSGDAHNSGHRVAGPQSCADGPLAGSIVRPGWTGHLTGVGVADHQLVVWGYTDASAFVEWQRTDGPRRIELPTIRAVDRVLPLAADDVIVAWQSPLDAGFFHLAEYGGGETPAWNHAIPSEPIAVSAVVPSTIGFYLVGGATADGDRVVRIENASGLVDERRFTGADGPVGLFELLTGPDHGAIMVTGDGTAVALRRLDAELAETGFVAHAPDGLALRPVAATIDDVGVVRVLVAARASDGTTSARLLRFGADLALDDDRVVDAVGAMATTPSGASLVVTGDALVRFGPGSELGLARPLPGELAVPPMPIAADGSVFALAFERGAGESRELVFAEAEPSGLLGCEAVGLCANLPVTMCERPEACVRAGCDPTSGLCASEAVERCP